MEKATASPEVNTKGSAQKGKTKTASQGTDSSSASDKGEKIYCANCANCLLVQSPAGRAGQYVLRVRCTAGKWRKKLGEEKIYKYFTVARRSIDHCDAYTPMGDAKEFIRELKKTLPIKDEVYKKNPSY